MARHTRRRYIKGLFATRKRSASIVVVVLLLIAVVAWHERPSHKADVIIPSATSSVSRNSQSSQNSLGGASGVSGSSTSTAITTPDKGTVNGGGSSGSTTLLTPWGTFVSNHHPGQSGAPTTETSTCNTTPGATCYIEFTLNGKARKLDARTAGGDGSIVWNWDIKDAGFSSGSWQVTAVVTQNGQTKTADDPQPLVIQ